VIAFNILTPKKPVPTKYIEQNLKDELFEDEWEEFQKLKASDKCEGFSDRFLMACLFARKLDIPRTEEMLAKFVDIPVSAHLVLEIRPGEKKTITQKSLLLTP
jgi:hypothetical protein